VTSAKKLLLTVLGILNQHCYSEGNVYNTVYSKNSMYDGYKQVDTNVAHHSLGFREDEIIYV